MPRLNRCLPPALAVTLLLSGPAFCQDLGKITTTPADSGHRQSAQQHASGSTPGVEAPKLPADMTLDEVLDYAAGSPPGHFPKPVPDQQLYAFILLDQLEYRFADDQPPDQLGWDVQGWFGGDFNKFWWKNEGEAVFEGADEGETETDLLYSYLFSPFWNLQFGAQYANQWATDEYEDRWSGVIAMQGLAPYQFEIDSSLYLSEDGDLTFEFEAEYDVRVTQRLVLQPRAELDFAFQEIPSRNLGEGLTATNLDLRLRYEIKRELAPYLGIRYRFLVGETDHLAEAAEAESEWLFFMTGLRLAF